MPKTVDHARRREEIALAACELVATRGFAQATVVRIARAAGYSSGMLAHYFDSKQEIILEALRLILHRMEHRLMERAARTPNDLLGVLGEALPIDPQRRAECAFWVAFWGQVSADRKLKRLNAWVHREYLRLFRRCLDEHWPESRRWSTTTRERTLRSVVTFINGITASAVSSSQDWPALEQQNQLRLQLRLLRSWARSGAK